MEHPVSADLSVVIPCYCASATIERAVTSVIHQTLPPQAIFLVEDNSPDDGATRIELESLLQRYQGRHGIRLVLLQSPTNEGPGSARNRAWACVETRYIAFLDADDIWHPRKVKLQYGLMCAHPEYVMTGHQCQILREGDALPDVAGRVEFNNIGKVALLFKNRFFTRTVMLDARLPNRFANKRFSEDYLLWLEIIADGNKAGVLDYTLAFSFKRAFGEGGLTARLWEMERGELDTYHRLYEGHRLSRLTMFFATAVSLLKYGIRVLRAKFYRSTTQDEEIRRIKTK